VPFVRLAHVAGGPSDPLTALLLAAPEPGSEEREEWVHAVVVRLAAGRSGGRK